MTTTQERMEIGDKAFLSHVLQDSKKYVTRFWLWEFGKIISKKNSGHVKVTYGESLMSIQILVG